MAMSSHVTLRGLMGLGDEQAPLQDSALIMIDCQNAYRRGVCNWTGAEDAFAEAARMLARARASGIPVSTSCTTPARVALRRHRRDRPDQRRGGSHRGRACDRQELPELVLQTGLGAQLEKTAGTTWCSPAS